MHVGCARWQTDYVKVNEKKLRMCYFYPGQKANYDDEKISGEKVDHKDPVKNCFCRIHARAIQENKQKTEERTARWKREVAGGGYDSMSDVLDEESASPPQKPAKLQAEAILKKKKQRILDDSEEE